MPLVEAECASCGVGVGVVVCEVGCGPASPSADTDGPKLTNDCHGYGVGDVASC